MQKKHRRVMVPYGYRQCPMCRETRDPDSAYIVQSKSMRDFCCSEQCARAFALENKKDMPFIILPPTAYMMEDTPTEEMLNAWQPILIK
jgi:hypothetical protein